MKKSSSQPDSFLLLTGLAQKINSPLKALLLSSQKLLDTYKSKDFEYISYKDFKHMLVTLEQMNKQIHRCYETTQRMVGLDHSEKKQEACNINDVINDVAKIFRQQAFLNEIRYQIRLNKNISLVNLNRLDGHQVIHNVLANAIQALPAGGVIKICTSFDKKTNSVLVEVLDDGVGISPENLSNIFEPFFTTRGYGVEKSSGLGLSVVHAIVQAVGGSIHVQSSLRKGTQVKILLPVVSE